MSKMNSKSMETDRKSDPFDQIVNIFTNGLMRMFLADPKGSPKALEKRDKE
jgi:hypothetical protein